MRRFIYILLAVSLLVGCGGVREFEMPDFSKHTWPNPPHQPRVKLLRIISTDFDIRQKTQSEFLFGEVLTFAFKKPHGIAVDREGTILISDTYISRVTSINLEQKRLGTLFNPYGWRQLGGLATDNKNGLIGATNGNTVDILDQKSKKALLTLGAKEGLIRPSGVAFDPDRKRIYISDTKKHEIHAYDYDGNHLELIAGVGSQPGDVYYPLSVAVNPAGELYVVDSMNFRVQIFRPDYTFKSAFGEHGDMPGMFARPKGIAINKDGMVFITDAAFGNVQIFRPDGTIFGFVGAPGVGPGRFNQPQGITVDDNDKIYVVDQTNRRIQIFQWMSVKYLQEHPEDIVRTPEAAIQMAPEGLTIIPQETEGTK